MARNWLASAELPGKFWFYAVKRATEICNYFPLKLDDGSWTTPLELAHKSKLDARVLFKMFGLAAVCREQVSDSRLGKLSLLQNITKTLLLMSILILLHQLLQLFAFQPIKHPTSIQLFLRMGLSLSTQKNY